VRETNYCWITGHGNLISAEQTVLSPIVLWCYSRSNYLAE